MGQILPRLLVMWNSLTPVRKGLLTASGVGLLVMAFLVNSWAGQTEYVWERVNLTRKQTGINLLRSYMQIRRMLYTPSLPDVGGDKKLGAEDWYAAVSVESRAQLGLEAIVTKDLLNLSNPGTVEDDVPDISAGILALIADATKGG